MRSRCVSSSSKACGERSSIRRERARSGWPTTRTADPFNPVLTATVAVPHPNMLRLSRDNRRLYVSNSLLTPWDNDPGFGPSRNNDYGIWLFDVNRHSGGLRSVNPDGSAWVRFAAVRKKTSVGPAGPHMMLFDPSIRLAPGEH